MTELVIDSIQSKNYPVFMPVKRKSKKVCKYTAFFEPAEGGGYVVYVPSLPGCVTQGETFEEAVKMAKDAIKGYLAVLRKDHDPIPVEQELTITAPIFVPFPS